MASGLGEGGDLRQWGPTRDSLTGMTGPTRLLALSGTTPPKIGPAGARHRPRTVRTAPAVDHRVLGGGRLVTVVIMRLPPLCHGAGG